jgi:protein-tyrosine phosphatase
MKKNLKVLFVCLGNICRSPAGEGILKHLLVQNPSLDVTVASCGMGDWHVGHAADARMQEAIKMRGITLTSRAQKFQREFLDQFDYILAADKEVLTQLYHYAQTPQQKSKISLMTEFSSIYKGQEVPDPYYEEQRGFEFVIDMLEDSCQGLVEHLHTLRNH